MSSHHFVKEDQEPALILTDVFALQDVAGLLEWSPFIIAFSGALESVVLNGIHVDAAINSESLPALHERPDNFQRLVATDDLNSQFDTALEVLKLRGARHVNIWTLDAAPVMKKVESLPAGIGIVVVDKTTTWARITSLKFSKWLPEGAIVAYHGSEAPRLSNGRLHNGEVTVQQSGLVDIQGLSTFWVGESRTNNSHE